MGAPQVTIETITVTRPLKVIAFTCCFITVILMVAATSTADWMLADGWREGLFMQCISAGAETPLPFDMPEQAGCGAVRSASYLRGAAALVIIGLIFDFFGTFLTGLGLRSTDPNKKYKYYRVAIYALILALIALLLAAIIYPVQFSKDLANDSEDSDDDGDGVNDAEDEDDDGDGIDDDGSDENEDDDDAGARTYTFGFGYGATWGSIILIFASVVLLICDRESEEIFYKERQVEEEEEEENGEA